MSTALRRRGASALVPFVLVIVVAVALALALAPQAPPSARTAAPPVQRAELSEAAAAVARTIVRPTTPPAPAPTTTTTAPAPALAPSDPSTVPPVGQATAWGCGAALTYLEAYAARGFTFECPGNADGHDAMTCLNEASCPAAALIAIADPCPAAYMNEASNSFVLTGASDAPIDPYGPCP